MGWSVLVVAIALAGCVNQNTWSPTVDPYTDPNAARLGTDEAQCRQIANQSAGSSLQQTGKGALIGGLLGAAAGAAIGAAGCAHAPWAHRFGHPVHVNEVVALSQHGVAPDQIVAKMNRGGLVYNLSEVAYVEIRERGVTPQVIAYMQAPTHRPSGSTRLGSWFAAALVAALLGACGTRAPSRFYTPASTATTGGAPALGTGVMVGPVSVPASVDRPEFVVQVAPNRVEVDEFNAGPRRSARRSLAPSPETSRRCSRRCGPCARSREGRRARGATSRARRWRGLASPRSPPRTAARWRS
jgi:uncharacterized lipoprotein YmbA